MATVEWIGPPVKCNNPNLQNGWLDFYRSFTYKGEQYDVGELALIKQRDGTRSKVARLICVYHSHEKWHSEAKYRGTIQWYDWAENVKTKLKPNNIEFIKNEVIQDNSSNALVDISLETIERKCEVLLGVLEDNHYIEKKNLDPDINFICRYRIELNELKPIFNSKGELNAVLTKVDESHTSETPTKYNLRKRTAKNSIGESDKDLSPKSFLKNLKLTPKHISKANQQIEAKETPKTNSVKSYSIVRSDLINDFKIKFKVKLNKKKSESDEKVVQQLENDSDELQSTNNFDAITETPNQRSKNLRPRSNSISAKRIVSKRRSTRLTITKSYAQSPPSPDLNKNTKTASKVSKQSKIEEETRSKKYSEIKDSSVSIEKFSPEVHRNKLNQSVQKTNNCLRTRSESALVKVDKETSIKTTSHMDDPRKKNSSSRNKSTDDGNNERIPHSSDGTEPKQDVCKILNYSVLKNEFQTPKTIKKNTNRPISSSKQATPSAKMKMIREGIISPSVQSRASSLVSIATPLAEARSRLHVSYVPLTLPCRQKEFDDIMNFLIRKLNDRCGGCMYISGVPGTGKTATVTLVVDNLKRLAANRHVHKFDYVNINGMRLSEPRQSYVEIVRQLMGKTVRWEEAQDILNTKFTVAGKASRPIVLVVDELDVLCTKRQDVVYNLLDWPTKAKTQVVVITIANTMDLPERLLMGRVTSRLGLTRLTFYPYTYKQLSDIITNRLVGTDSFDSDAIQLVVRKVASVSGDARRALDICRRAAEVAEIDGPATLVTMKHIDFALNSMITQPKVRAIRHCSRLQKFILEAVVAEVERTGVEETNFMSVFSTLATIAGADGFSGLSSTVVMSAIKQLGACRLLLIEDKNDNIHFKIILNVSSDDVYYALRTKN